jgi:hypothetical protein
MNMMTAFPLRKSKFTDDEHDACLSPKEMHSRGIGWSQECRRCEPQRKPENTCQYQEGRVSAADTAASSEPVPTSSTVNLIRYT